LFPVLQSAKIDTYDHLKSVLSEIKMKELTNVKKITDLLKKS
jgi:hypothetical protein